MPELTPEEIRDLARKPSTVSTPVGTVVERNPADVAEAEIKARMLEIVDPLEAITQRTYIPPTATNKIHGEE